MVKIKYTIVNSHIKANYVIIVLSGVLTGSIERSAKK